MAIDYNELKRITEAQAREAVKAAYDETPEKYRRYIVVIKQGKRLTPAAFKQHVYADVETPYMKVDGRIAEAIDEHKDAGETIEITTDTEIIGDQVVIVATVNSPIRGKASGRSPIRFGGKGVDGESPVENGECLDINAQILTREGFKFYHQLKIGEEALTYNCSTMISEWLPVRKVSVYENMSVCEMKNSRFHAVCTPDHKWVTLRGKPNLNPANELRPSDRILISAPEAKTDLGFEDDAARLGWMFTDGSINYLPSGLASRAYIRQSKAKHFPQLDRLFGEGKLTKNYNPDRWNDAYEWEYTALDVRRVLGRWGVNTYNDLPRVLCQMTITEVQAYFDACMAADGYGRGFAKTFLPIVESMQIACTRLGIRTGAITTRNTQGSTKPLYLLPILKTPHAYVSQINFRNCPPRTVWCPTTDNGTWVARQYGRVFITGNTSAIGRALGFLNYGNLGTGIASYEEVLTNLNAGSEPKIAQLTDKQRETLTTKMKDLGCSDEQIQRELGKLTTADMIQAFIERTKKAWDAKAKEAEAVFDTPDYGHGEAWNPVFHQMHEAGIEPGDFEAYLLKLAKNGAESIADLESGMVKKWQAMVKMDSQRDSLVADVRKVLNLQDTGGTAE